MATPTANYGFIKDAPTQLYDVQVVNANLDAIDATIKARKTEGDAADAALDHRLDTIENWFSKDVPTVITNPFTATTNWTVNEERIYVWGPVVFGNLTVTRKNSTLVSTSDGNIGNQDVVDWNSGMTNYLPYYGSEAAWCPSSGGKLFSGYVHSSGVAVNALVPGSTGSIPVGGALYGSFTYFRNMPG